MGVLKRKQESEAITFKLPAALKREIEQLRSRAEDAGFDLGETITAAMWRLCKQIKAGLEGAPRPGRKLNGRVSEPSTEKLQLAFSGISPPLLRHAERWIGGRGWWRGKGRSFVGQDKATAVRYGIFCVFPNELAAFSSRRLP